jgi:site-specific recombinase XerD
VAAHPRCGPSPGQREHGNDIISRVNDARTRHRAKDHRAIHRAAGAVKNGTPATHPLRGDELRVLRRLQRESAASPFVFVSERGSPFGTAGFGRMVERAAKAAGLNIKVHAHMLRHACGFALANAGHDTRAIQGYLGHRNISNTVKYTEMAADRFKDFWR